MNLLYFDTNLSNFNTSYPDYATCKGWELGVLVFIHMYTHARLHIYDAHELPYLPHTKDWSGRCLNLFCSCVQKHAYAHTQIHICWGPMFFLRNFFQGILFLFLIFFFLKWIVSWASLASSDQSTNMFWAHKPGLSHSSHSIYIYLYIQAQPNFFCKQCVFLRKWLMWNCSYGLWLTTSGAQRLRGKSPSACRAPQRTWNRFCVWLVWYAHLYSTWLVNTCGMRIDLRHDLLYVVW
jgi:hypothetical protein